jgi:hypothetical protein
VAFAFRNLANDGRALDLLIRYEASLTRAYDRAAKQLDLLQNRKVRNEPTEPVTHPSAPTLREPWLPVGPDPTRAIPVVIKCTPPEAPAPLAAQPEPSGSLLKKGTDHSVPNPQTVQASATVSNGQSGLSPFSTSSESVQSGPCCVSRREPLVPPIQAY